MTSKRGVAESPVQPARWGGSGSPQPKPSPLPPSPAPAGPTSTLPALGSSASKRFEWGSDRVGDTSTIMARRAASRTDSRGGTGAAGGSRAGTPALPEFWVSKAAPVVVDTSVGDPELKLQLLTRALEESRAKIHHLQHDREALSDTVLQLCLAAGASQDAVADVQAAAGGSDDALLPLHLDLLSAQIQQLQEALEERQVAVAEAQMLHERAALQVVAKLQQREALQQELEEVRYSCQQHERAQHAMQLKIELLEGQLEASAESARRRMEEQLEAFRGDAALARALQTKSAELVRQLAEAQRAQQDAEDNRRQLSAQLERAQGRLEELMAKQVELTQQLGDRTAAHSNLLEEHAALQDASRALAASNNQLEAALAACQQRAQQAEDLGAGLQAQCRAGQQQQAVLQEEAERLRAELQQERQRRSQLSAALAEEQLGSANLRAALQGQRDELTSLLLKLDEYSSRVVAAEGELAAARSMAAADKAARSSAEQEARAARHECASLRDSVADLAASEGRLKQQLGQAEEQLAAALAAQAEEARRRQQAEREWEASREQAQLLQGTVEEQAQQLGALQQLSEGQQQQLTDLKAELHSAAARAQAAQLSVTELGAGKQQAERELHKQQVLVRHLQEQAGLLGSQLKAAIKDAQVAVAQVEAAAAQAGQQREQHEAELAAQRQAHEQRRIRNQQLEHDNKQQAVIIAELQATCTSMAARLAAAQQQGAALHRYAVAHGAAYGRLAAHVAGLHQQLMRQLGGLLHLCRHVGLQLSSALSAADPVAALKGVPSQAGGGSTSSNGQGDGCTSMAAALAGKGTPADTEDTPAVEGACTPDPQAAVAAAVLCLESLRTELLVGAQLLEMQAGSSEVSQLASVPAGIAAALAADLEGLPYEPLSAPHLEPARWADSSSPSSRLAGAATTPQSIAAGTGSTTQRPAPGSPQLQLKSSHQHHHTLTHSALSAQVADMEGQLTSLVQSSAEQAARATAATALHEQERAARQQAQDLACRLRAQLTAAQADLAATRGQREAAEAQARRMAGELRDAIYTLGQMQAAQQGQAASWAVRGLKSCGVQTQYCQLWEAAMFGGGCSCSPPPGGEAALVGSNAPAAAPAAPDPLTNAGVPAGGDGITGTATEPGFSTAGDSCEVCHQAGSPASPPAAGSDDIGAGRVLPLPALLQALRAIYRAKAVHDIAVARGQRPFLPLADYLTAYLVQQHGSEGPAVRRRAQQLRASVLAHAEVYEVAMFGLAAGWLVEATSAVTTAAGAAAGAAQGSDAGSSALVVTAAGIGSSNCATATSPAPMTSAAVPLVLYAGARGSAIASSQAAAVPTLRRFCASDWHAAYLHSAARPPLPQPFNPVAPDLQLLHSMALEVHSLALSVPGVEQLMSWVLGGGLSACLPHLDLGLRLAENQVPQLYLLAVESCRLLGLSTTPQLFVHSSLQAPFAFYLLLPSTARLHGLNGSCAQLAEEGQLDSLTACPSKSSSSSIGGGSSVTAAAAAAAAAAGAAGAAAGDGPEWQCVLVLSSRLVDLLEPAELQAVLAGCLGFHAALTSAAGAASDRASNAGRRDSVQPQQAQQAPLAAVCTSMAALATLAALCTLAPDTLTRRLPHQMEPFFYSRIQSVLLRALRYLSLFCDRVGAAAVGSWQPVAAAIAKQAAGCAVLRDELSLEAMLHQAQQLEAASLDLLPKALLHEEGAALAGAGPSLALLRIRELHHWWQQR